MGMKLSDRGGSNGFGGYQNVAKEGGKSLWLVKAGVGEEIQVEPQRRKVDAKRFALSLRLCDSAFILSGIGITPNPAREPVRMNT